ncbi:MAG TPA: protein phosphatase 2C domain-containing protein [Anaerolineales bacterium]|nr:protein phosphatase 2C domain-containing protein [Anaerolineales bacterium]
MATILLGSDSNPGGRKYNEDRCAADHLVTRSGLRLDVALVCDGVGGEEHGERAAQLAVDTVFSYLRTGPETEVTRLITSAIRAANAAIFAEAERLGGNQAMASTLVLALVVDGLTLHIANVGDSRAYLYRNGTAQQLTRDHTFANVMVWLGKLTPEAAESNPDANKVMRALGQHAALQVDQGIYLTTTDYGEANAFGRAGFPLRAGDSILLCSDGLIKDAPSTGQPLITTEEIARTLQTVEGPAAAQAVISAALGRIPIGDPVDNITVAVLQTEDPARAVNRLQQQAAQQRRQRTRLALVALAVAIPLIGLLVLTVGAFAGFFALNRRTLNTTATYLARGTAQALLGTRTAEAWTSTPTVASPTPFPTLVPGEIGKLFDARQLLSVLLGDNRLILVPGGEAWFIAVNHRGFGANAYIHLDSGTQIQLKAVTDANVEARLLEGSRIFVQSGPYPNGSEIEVGGWPVVLSVRGCLGAEHIDADALTALCFQGVCSLSLDFGVTTETLGAGQSVTLDANRLESYLPRSFSAADASPYWDLLQRTTAGQIDAHLCNVAAPPVITSTSPPQRQPGRPPAATNTPVPPTATNEPPPPPPPPDTPVPPTDPPATQGTP